MKSLKITFIALFSLAALASCESSEIAPVSNTPGVETIGSPAFNGEEMKLQPEILNKDDKQDVVSPGTQKPEAGHGVGIVKEFVSVVD
jgi:hypothetical protein